MNADELRHHLRQQGVWRVISRLDIHKPDTSATPSDPGIVKEPCTSLIYFKPGCAGFAEVAI